MRLVSRWGVVLAAAAALAAPSASRAEPIGADFAVKLDADSFQRHLDEYEVMIVDFHAPWCIHCQRLAPIQRGRDGGGQPVVRDHALDDTDWRQ